MNQPVTVLAPFQLAKDKTEADLIAASNQFQKAFVSKYAGVLRREIIKTGNGKYTDIVQFRSREDAEKIMAAEAQSEDCHVYFSVMDMSDGDNKVEFHPSLATYTQNS